MASNRLLLFFLVVCSSFHLLYCQQTCGIGAAAGSVSFAGPSPAPECRYEYIVSLKHPQFRTHFCTGSLIAPAWVLTSASCARGSRQLPIAHINGYVRDRPFTEVEVHVEEVMVHESFRGTSLDPFDVALYRLIRPSAQTPVSLTSSSVATGRLVDVLGWGRVQSQGALSDLLQLGESLEVVPCGGAWPSVPEGFACVEGSGNVACPGDAGSPVLISGSSSSSDVQIGITTNVMGDCGLSGRPGPFLEISRLRSWIAQHIGQ